MEGETQALPSCVSKVLDVDDLLVEIIVRVGFPSSLVQAAVVCRRWLRLASDRAFLRRFRKLHPPRLLGFYLAKSGYQGVHSSAASFFPMLPQPPPQELAPMIRRASFGLEYIEGAGNCMVHCWNGKVVTSRVLHMLDREGTWNQTWRFTVRNPLCPERGMDMIPELRLHFQEGNNCTFGQLFSREEGGYLYATVESTREAKSLVRIYMFRNGDPAWTTHLSLAADSTVYARSKPDAVLLNDSKIYMASDHNEILVLNLTAATLSAIQLPKGVDFHATGTTLLSRADDPPGVYLIHLNNELKLHVWLHTVGDSWSLEDEISHEMCAHSLHDEPGGHVQINHVGDYTTGFLFLQMGRCALYLDVKSRTLRKVYEMTNADQDFGTIYPFTMPWPPIFPVLKDSPTSNAT